MSLEDLAHMRLKIAPTLMILATLVVASVAVPAMAQPDDRGRPSDAGRPTGAGQSDRSDEAGNGAGRENRTRGPPAHVMERIESRCEAIENETGRRPAGCDHVAAIHSEAHRARRAAHAGLHAVAAWEHLNETLSKLEDKFEAKLAQGNLTENQTAAYQAKLEKIDAMQERLALRIDAMEGRIAELESRHEAVREHVEARRAARGDAGDDGAGDDGAGAADGDDGSIGDGDDRDDGSIGDGDDGGDGNATVE